MQPGALGSRLAGAGCRRRRHDGGPHALPSSVSTLLLIEKAETVGGTTARSAGSVWVPNSRHGKTADTRAQALRYLQGTVGNRLRSEMADAFLDNAPRMVDFLEANSEVRFRAYAHHPDYAPGVGGSTTSGRVLEPVPFDARVLGRDFATLSAPLPEFTVFGGMMVDRTDIGHLLGARARSARSVTPPAMRGAARRRPAAAPPRHPAGHGQCSGGTSALLAQAAQRERF